MPSQETMVLVMLAGFALSASPGPSMLYVLSRSIGQDRKAGLISAAGLAAGGVIHAVAAAIGLAATLAYSPALYRSITTAGAVYLIYLGIQAFRSRHEGLGATQSVARAPAWRIFYQGALVEVLNPKTALFFVAFLPQFISHDSETLAMQVLVLGMLIPLTAVPSDLLVAFTGGTLARRIATHRTARSCLSCLGAACLIGLGVRFCFV